VNGRLVGSTDAAGRFEAPTALSAGDTLFARSQVFELPTARPFHGPNGGWAERVWQTSRTVRDDGGIDDFVVQNPAGTQVLTVDPDSALLGWHLVVSLDWDATEAEMIELEDRFHAASQYLFDLTDGQFFLAQVDLSDDAQQWSGAEIQFSADVTLWPHSTGPGNLVGPFGLIPPVIAMAPYGTTNSASDSPRTLVHELGHLAFGLMDEYVHPVVDNVGYCGEDRFSGTDPRFANNGPSAACAMDRQMVSNKLCSHQPGTAHRQGLWQVDPCWDAVAHKFGDPLGTRWTVVTPDQRGAVVGALPPLPEGLRTNVVRNNRVRGTLCAPFAFDGGPGTVWIRPATGAGDYPIGGGGPMTVRGAHLGDQLWTPSKVVSVDATLCVQAQ
jgi:hypothetical protein